MAWNVVPALCIANTRSNDALEVIQNRAIFKDNMTATRCRRWSFQLLIAAYKLCPAQTDTQRPKANVPCSTTWYRSKTRLNINNPFPLLKVEGHLRPTFSSKITTSRYANPAWTVSLSTWFNHYPMHCGDSVGLGVRFPSVSNYRCSSFVLWVKMSCASCGLMCVCICLWLFFYVASLWILNFVSYAYLCLYLGPKGCGTADERVERGA